MPQVGADGARPLDVARARTARAPRSVERAANGFRRLPLQALHELGDDLADDLARHVAGPVRQDTAQRDEIGDEIHVLFHSGEEFRLHQHLFQAEALEGVLLHDLPRKEGTNVADPAGDGARRGTSGTATALFLFHFPVAIERGKRGGRPRSASPRAASSAPTDSGASVIAFLLNQRGAQNLEMRTP
jgi:hypothetical protein